MQTTANTEDNELVEPDVQINDPEPEWDMDW
jgi:hypothetical protein